MTTVIENKPNAKLSATLKNNELQMTNEVGPQQLLMPDDKDPVGTRKTTIVDIVTKDDIPRFRAGIAKQLDSLQGQKVSIEEKMKSFEAQGVLQLGPKMDALVQASEKMKDDKKGKNPEKAHDKFMRVFTQTCGPLFNAWRQYNQLAFQLNQVKANISQAESHLNLIDQAIAVQ